jgi:hypothetical protein
MPTGNVRITDPEDRQIYVNGVYTAPNPRTSPCTIAVEYGKNTFETLNAEQKIDFRGEATTDEDHRYTRLALDPVVPPEATLLRPAPDD